MKEKKQNGLEKMVLLGLLVILFFTVTGNLVRFIFAPIMNEISVEINREFSEERMDEFSAEIEALGEALDSEFEQLGEEVEREFEAMEQELDAASELEYGR
jgi:hypothetical protein